jgi:leucyl aminopeptidase
MTDRNNRERTSPMIEPKTAQGDIAQQATDCIVVNLFEGVSEPAGATGAIDRALDGAISTLIETGDFTGAAGTTALLYTNGRLPSPRVLIVGLGEVKGFDFHGVRSASAAAAAAVRKLKGVRAFSSIVHGGGAAGLDAEAAARATVEGTLLALYRAPQYRRNAEEPGPEGFTLVEFNADKASAVQAGAEAGAAIAHGVSSARD